jgi:hypothetical protein
MKKTTKALKLNRETVRLLVDPVLAGVAAGATSHTYVCCTATHGCSGCLPCA